jgi:hypothetical protein
MVSQQPTASGGSFLQTRSANARGLCKGALYKRRISSAKRTDTHSATDTMTESSLLEALTAKVRVCVATIMHM